MRPVVEVEECRELALSHPPMLSAYDGPIETIWRPSEDTIDRANITRYLEWLARHRGLTFATYSDLLRWSVTDLAAVLGTIWQIFGHHPSHPVAPAAQPG